MDFVPDHPLKGICEVDSLSRRRWCLVPKQTAALSNTIKMMSRARAESRLAAYQKRFGFPTLELLSCHAAPMCVGITGPQHSIPRELELRELAEKMVIVWI